MRIIYDNICKKGDIHRMHYAISVIIFFFILIAWPSRAWAYIDPGAGSYIFQILIGLMLGVFFVIKVYWKNLKNFIRNKLFRHKQ